EFLAYSDEEMDILKREYGKNLLNAFEGNFDPEAYHEIWWYTLELQKIYEHLEALFHVEEEEEIGLMDEDHDDFPYYE
ncbi:hypothetical protein KI387_011877, partial [Taxus chinensis]